MDMKHPALSAATLAAVLLASGCQKSEDVSDDNSTNATASTPATPTAASMTSPAAAPCPLTADQVSEWRALIDAKPPVPEGGRPLTMRGKVDLAEDGFSTMLTPGELVGTEQHFTLEVVPNDRGSKGLREVSTGIFPAPKATMAIIDCGGKMLDRVSVETSH
jgi:hypothetical protein